MKKIKIDKNYLIILIITIIVTLPFFSNKYIVGEDTLYHLANIDSITKDFLNLNFTKITGTILNGLGYGGGIFYPKLPHFFASLINLFVKDTITALKISEIIIVFLSGTFMYILLKKMNNNKTIALLGSIFYITTSFLMRDLYIRNCYNEMTIFVFMPIIFLSLEYLKEDKENIFIILFSIGYICIMNTHLVMSVYFTILILLYLIINYKIYLTKNNIIRFLKASIIILIYCMPTLILIIEHKISVSYIVFLENEMYSLSDIKKNSLNLFSYFIPNMTNTKNYYFNIAEIIGIVLSTIFLIKDKNKKRVNQYYSIGILILVAIIMSTKLFPYQYLPKLLLEIQAPFRCASFVCFFGAIYSVYYLNYIKEKDKITRLIIVIISIIISIVTIIPCIKEVKLYEAKLLNWDKCSGLGWQHEYLTVTGRKYKKYYNKENKIISLNNNKVKIKEIENNTPKLIAKISNVKKTTTLELPRLYYLGYNIKYKTKTKTYKLNYKLDKYGFIKVNIKEPGTIYVKYTGTILYNIFRIIRLIFIISLIIYLIKNKKIKIKE